MTTQSEEEINMIEYSARNVISGAIQRQISMLRSGGNSQLDEPPIIGAMRRIQAELRSEAIAYGLKMVSEPMITAIGEQEKAYKEYMSKMAGVDVVNPGE